MCGTWLAKSGTKNDVLTPGTFVISCEILPAESAIPLLAPHGLSARKSSSALTIPRISSFPTFWLRPNLSSCGLLFSNAFAIIIVTPDQQAGALRPANRLPAAEVTRS